MEQTEASIISRHIEEKLSAYWHDVDFDWGRNAGAHYTKDGVFEGLTISYESREQIEAFYRWRKERGARVNVHLVGNFYCKLVSDSKAEVSWICTLFAHDGAAPQPSAPPIAISRVADIFVKEEDGQWRCARRTWHSLFKGGVPTTGMNSEEMAKMLAKKAQ